MKKSLITLLCLIALLSFATPVFASVDSYASGIFRGSMRYVVTLDSETTVSNVAAGDFLAFAYPDKTYIGTGGHEDVELYIRRYDFSKEVLVYDLSAKKFQELALGESASFDLDLDGVNDVVVHFTKLDRKGSFVVDFDCGDSCSKDDMMNESDDVVLDESQDVVDDSMTDDVSVDGVVNADDEVSGDAVDTTADAVDSQGDVSDDAPVQEKSVLLRFLEWLARLF